MTIAGRRATVLVAGLILSVCVNLLVGGIVVGNAIARMDPNRWDPFRRFVATLPPSVQETADDRFADDVPLIGDRVAALKDARRAVANLLTEPGATSEQIAAALADVRTRSTALQEIMHRVLAEATTEMPPTVRSEWKPRWWTIR